MAVVSGTVATGLGLAKLLKLLKAAKLATAAAGKRAAGSKLAGWAGKAAQRAGYDKRELLWNVIPDLAMNAMYVGQVPGDPLDKALAIGSNIVVGQGTAALGRSAVNMGKTRRLLDKINAQKRAALTNGTKLDPRILALEDKLAPRMGLGQGMEVAGMMAGGPLGYEVGEALQRGKSFLGGQGYLSPTDRLFAEQDEQTQLQMLQAYEAGLAAGGQKGYYTDPYTGDVALSGDYYG